MMHYSPTITRMLSDHLLSVFCFLHLLLQQSTTCNHCEPLLVPKYVHSPQSLPCLEEFATFFFVKSSKVMRSYLGKCFFLMSGLSWTTSSDPSFLRMIVITKWFLNSFIPEVDPHRLLWIEYLFFHVCQYQVKCSFWNLWPGMRSGWVAWRITAYSFGSPTLLPISQLIQCLFWCWTGGSPWAFWTQDK